MAQLLRWWKLVVPLWVMACAAPAARQPRAIVEPSGTKEVCLELRVGDRVRYWFDADDPVDFDIHHHEDGRVTYPQRENQISAGEGIFTPESARRYCFAWKNTGPTGIALSYKLSIVGP